MIKAGIIGATGYVGGELARILMSHTAVALKTVTSQSYAGKAYGEVFENFRHTDFVCQEENIEAMAETCDVIFLALPLGLASFTVRAELLKKTTVIDLGADFRLKELSVYEQWYETKHGAAALLNEAVYGLCEINREKIAGKRLIANPGCYTTCSILSLYPLLKEGMVDADSLIIDAKSGVTGAGRGVGLGTHFCETNENIKAYKIAGHRHTPEIEEQLSYAAGKDLRVTFTPHLTPMNRGILAACYAKLSKKARYDDIKKIYTAYYGEEYFIRLTKENSFPETKFVKGTNFMDIGFAVDERTNRVIVIGAIDNLVKGAAGQAVQNMNILFGLDEKTGLEYIPVFPA
ncbi:MAG: N-acetyl-gamma-glutamyl-phosphate reductase [Clostridiales bacterium]|nr:N-acetyl-gamma-glutamyl-phosphate reductase [Clostridiales bacterium]